MDVLPLAVFLLAIIICQKVMESRLVITYRGTSCIVHVSYLLKGLYLLYVESFTPHGSALTLKFLN